MTLQIANNTTSDPLRARPSALMIGVMAALTAYALIAAAFLVLLVSLYELKFTKSNHGRWGDSPLSFDVPPQQPAVLAIVVSTNHAGEHEYVC